MPRISPLMPVYPNGQTDRRTEMIYQYRALRAKLYRMVARDKNLHTVIVDMSL